MDLLACTCEGGEAAYVDLEVVDEGCKRARLLVVSELGTAVQQALVCVGKKVSVTVLYGLLRSALHKSTQLNLDPQSSVVGIAENPQLLLRATAAVELTALVDGGL